MIFKLGVKYGVNPARISTELLSDADKEDMVSGELTFDALETAVDVWVQYGCQKYS